jgi:hypothetical protein
MNRVAAGLSRAAAVGAIRRTDPADPASWEFSGFSQNGEDGIIDYLLQNTLDRNRYFIEIGASDGLECNSAWLAIARRFGGLMIEGNKKSCQRAALLYSQLNLGVDCIGAFLTKENVARILESALYRDPDVFSLDIDGNDYYIAEAIMNAGFRPKVFVVEYNSALGPTNAVTIQYRDEFDFVKAHPTQLYYGVSVSGWRKFFARYGYSFVTVESNGVNAFFVQPSQFDAGFLDRVRGSTFRENFYQFKKFKRSWEAQLKSIEGETFVSIA